MGTPPCAFEEQALSHDGLQRIIVKILCKSAVAMGAEGDEHFIFYHGGLIWETRAVMTDEWMQMNIHPVEGLHMVPEPIRSVVGYLPYCENIRKRLAILTRSDIIEGKLMTKGDHYLGPCEPGLAHSALHTMICRLDEFLGELDVAKQQPQDTQELVTAK